MPTEIRDGRDPDGIAPEYAGLFARALPFLQTRDNEIHTRISHGYALRLLEEGGDPAVVLPAILLHDIGWCRVPPELQLQAIGPTATKPELRDVHEAEGAVMAAELLAELGYGEERIRRIRDIVAGHDSKLTADSLEEALVKDADKLFRFSPEGFRILAGWYGFDLPKLLVRLEALIPEWFLTERGARLAREEAAARREELLNEEPAAA